LPTPPELLVKTEEEELQPRRETRFKSGGWSEEKDRDDCVDAAADVSVLSVPPLLPPPPAASPADLAAGPA
jgi:hypothetical protein